MPSSPIGEIDPAAIALDGFWRRLDHKLGIAFFVVVGGGGIFIPLGIMVLSWFR